MLFTLEAIQAKHGDCLLLHFGTTAEPKLCVIDGGPSGVYGNFLKPRLLEIKKARSANAPLPIDLMMVSHIDDDHICGIVDLFMDFEQPSKPMSYKIANFWFNSFDDIIGKPATQLASVSSSGTIKTASGAAATTFPLNHTAKLVVASVPQGRTVRDLSKKYCGALNKGAGGDLVLYPTNPSPVKLDGGLNLCLAGPSKERLKNLQATWDKELKKLKDKGEDITTAAYVDNSVTNLSSIVVLAESGGKTILLTGDARGDDILSSLRESKLLTGATMPIDILKLPHHGSVRDVAEDFFKALPAKHYVVSANGKYENPDLATMKMLTKVRTDDDFTIHLTNQVDWLTKLFADDKQAGRKYSVAYLPTGKNSLTVDLGDKLTI